MKVEIKEKEVKTSINYPYLGVHYGKEFIVLFTEKATGFVVQSRIDTRPIGYYISTWAEYQFESFNGTITLSND